VDNPASSGRGLKESGRGGAQRPSLSAATLLAGTSNGTLVHAGVQYNRSVVRKCASFACGLALIVALGFAMAHAQPLKAPGGSTGFSTPCEPASPAFKATSELETSFDDRFDLRCRKDRSASRSRARIPRRSCLAVDSAPGTWDLRPFVPSAPSGQLLI